MIFFSLAVSMLPLPGLPWAPTLGSLHGVGQGAHSLGPSLSWSTEAWRALCGSVGEDGV